MIEILLNALSNGLFGWFPRLRLVDQTQVEVTFWFLFGKQRGVSTHSGESYWAIPWLTEIYCLSCVSDPSNYKPVRITSLDGSTWAINVSVSWQLMVPEHAVLRSEDVETDLRVLSDSVMVAYFRGLSDAEVIALANQPNIESTLAKEMTRRAGYFGYEALHVNFQGFHKVRCFHLGGVR